MFVPLYRDIVLQKKQLTAFLAKLAAFLLVFGAFDRLAAGFLLAGVERSYGLDVPAEVLCVGHSHTALGIDKTALERDLAVPVAKYARNGANVADRLVMIKQYLDRQPPSVKVLVYDVDAHTFTGQGLSRNSYTLFYPFMDSPSVDAYVRQQAPLFDYYARHALKLRRFSLESCNDAVRGWLGMWSNLKHGTVDVERLKEEIASGQVRHISFDEECIKCFDETLRYVVEKGIHVVLLYIPTIDLYNEAEPEKHQHTIDLFREFSAKYDRVTFLDYRPAFARRHELFYDPIHLNPQGQRLVTERLAGDLKRILGRASGSPSECGKTNP
jgi:hypothetical protein